MQCSIQLGWKSSTRSTRRRPALVNRTRRVRRSPRSVNLATSPMRDSRSTTPEVLGGRISKSSPSSVTRGAGAPSNSRRSSARRIPHCARLSPWSASRGSNARRINAFARTISRSATCAGFRIEASSATGLFIARSITTPDPSHAKHFSVTTWKTHSALERVARIANASRGTWSNVAGSARSSRSRLARARNRLRIRPRIAPARSGRNFLASAVGIGPAAQVCTVDETKLHCSVPRTGTRSTRIEPPLDARDAHSPQRTSP